MLYLNLYKPLGLLGCCDEDLDIFAGYSKPWLDPEMGQKYLFSYCLLRADCAGCPNSS